MDGGMYLQMLSNKKLKIQNSGLKRGLDYGGISEGFKLYLKQKKEKVNFRLAACGADGMIYWKHRLRPIS